jgi:hypothetical protein
MSQAWCRPKKGVVLACGATVYFGQRSPAPGIGDLVPCERHTSCTVVATAAPTSSSQRPARAPRRTRAELVRHLESRQAPATVGELRRLRFTLRLIAEAARLGEVELAGFDPGTVVRLQ